VEVRFPGDEDDAGMASVDGEKSGSNGAEGGGLVGDVPAEVGTEVMTDPAFLSATALFVLFRAS
jgi:hypothetical protein